MGKDRNVAKVVGDDWSTPPEFYSALHKEFDFDFDPCPLKHDLSKWDGLLVDWENRNFINPPYSRQIKEDFICKAVEESRKGKLCVMLIPVSTSTRIFHEVILPNKKEIRFVRGRLRFGGVNSKGEYVINKCGMSDSMLVIFDGREG